MQGLAQRGLFVLVVDWLALSAELRGFSCLFMPFPVRESCFREFSPLCRFPFGNRAFVKFIP